MARVEDICQGIPSERLDSPVTDIQIADLASELKTWEELAPYLGLTQADEEDIEVRYRHRYGLQKRQALRTWQSKVGRGPNGATYRNFIVALCRAKETEMDEKVRNLLTEPEQSATSAADHVLETFRKYLVDCYTIAQHPAQTQWPSSRLSSYIDLTLVQAPDSQTLPSGQDERAQPLKEVQLTELFHVGSHRASRKVVLIEGPAGCGKTTLSWYVCQEWAAGRLFQQFSLLIHISLEDDTLLSAKCLADIIPYGSCNMQEAVARGIYQQGGKGVCFLFDAWDEAPSVLHERKSYLSKFIMGISTRKLPHCSIVITSRPTAASLLYCYLTAHVNIRGFGATKLKQFICASLDDLDSRQKLLQQLREKPRVNDLCNLPINAAIVVHLFHHSPCSTLPTTRTGLFRALVCNLLVRNMQLRTHHKLLEVKEFECLPDDVLRDFYSVCSLAFYGIMKDRKAFLLDSFQKLGLKHPSSLLGLMQAQQQLTGFGARHCYSFLHYAVQEFLAAYHISKLSEEEQTKSVRQILHSTPLNTVLPFYAGLTGLSNGGVCDILLEVTKQPLDAHTVTQALIQDQMPVTQSGDRRRLVLALFNCIYESQKPSICELVKPPQAQIYGSMRKELALTGFPTFLIEFLSSHNIICSISFVCLGLDPVDCLSIGYFIRHASTKLAQVNVDLQQCCISDTETEILVRQVQGSTRILVYLQLDYNIVSHRAIKSLSDTLKSSALVGISLTGCLHPAITDIKLALKYLIEGVSRSKSLETLALEECYLSSAHRYHLALLARVSKIKILDVSSNNVRSAIPFIAEATKHNRIQRLHVFKCCISDEELKLLGEALQHNAVMHMTIFGNPFSLGAFTSFLNGLIGSNSVLAKLGVGHYLSHEQRCIVKKINSSRKQKPDLEVEPFIPTWKMGAEMGHTLRTIPPDLRTRSGIRTEDTWSEESAQPIKSLLGSGQ